MEDRGMKVEEMDISKRAKGALPDMGVKTARDLLEFSPARFFLYIPDCLLPDDLYGFNSALHAVFGSEVATEAGWSRSKIKALFREKRREKGLAGARALDFPPNTDGGMVNRFIHSATAGKHYKKPRWRRRL